VKTLLEQRKEQIRVALPRVVNPERFLRVALTTIQQNPNLLQCSMKSLVAGVMRSAQLGLSLDPVRKEAYLVPYRLKNGELTANFIVGYRGLMKLVYQTGQVRAMWAYVVHEKDQFDLDLGTNHTLTHKPYIGPDFPGPVVGAYAVALLSNGEKTFRFVPRWEIEAHRMRSQAASLGPWVTDYDAMACKTAIRVLANLLPQISEEEAVASVLASDERGEMGEQTPAMDMDLAPVPALSEPAQPEADTAQVTNWAADAEEKPQQGPEPPTKRRGRPKRSAPPAEETAKAPEAPEPAPTASSEAEEDSPEPEPQEPFGADGFFGEPEPEDTGLEQLKRRLQS
jgi:recombination protein RecT